LSEELKGDSALKRSVLAEVAAMRSRRMRSKGSPVSFDLTVTWRACCGG
jgi:hypothetical protein